MPAPDPQTMALRSGIVPQCAKRVRLLALGLFLLTACLNPMPEEFPSNDGDAVVTGIPGLKNQSRCAGSVHARNTISGGASNMRLRVKPRSNV